MDVGFSATQLASLAADPAEVLRLTIEYSAVGMALTDPQGNFLAVNPALVALLGREGSSFDDLTWQELTHPDDLAHDMELVRQMLAGEIDNYRFLKRYLRPDGSVMWGQLIVASVRNEDGSVRFFVTQVVDETAQQELIAESKQTNELLVAALDAELDPHIFLYALRDDHGTVIDFIVAQANPRAIDTLDHGAKKMQGAHLLQDFPNPTVAELFPLFVRTIESGEPLRLEGWLRPSEDGLPNRYLDLRGVRAGNTLSLSWRDVTERMEMHVELEQRARFDPLTGLMNRQEIFNHLDGVATYARRSSDEIGVLFCDVDHFKDVNDSQGHGVGDRVLRVMADRIQSIVRVQDFAARIGGDELLVVLHGVRDIDEALVVAEKIRVASAEPIETPFGHVSATLSIGVVLATKNEETDSLLERADRAMYEAKALGRNRTFVIRN